LDFYYVNFFLNA